MLEGLFITNNHASEDYALAHNTAVRRFLAHPEQPVHERRQNEWRILNIAYAIEGWVNSVEDWNYENFGDQYIASLLEGFRGLLNFDLGRLDGGTLDAWAWKQANRIGWDLDTDERTEVKE